MQEWFEHGREVYWNDNENAFYNKAQNEGWFVTKKGWPDFFCISPDGRVMVVEVKQSGKKSRKHTKSGWDYQGLRREQIIVMKALEKLGVDVRISDGSGETVKVDWEKHDTYRKSMNIKDKKPRQEPDMASWPTGWFDEFKQNRVDNGKTIEIT